MPDHLRSQQLKIYLARTPTGASTDLLKLEDIAAQQTTMNLTWLSVRAFRSFSTPLTNLPFPGFLVSAEQNQFLRQRDEGAQQA